MTQKALSSMGLEGSTIATLLICWVCRKKNKILQKKPIQLSDINHFDKEFLVINININKYYKKTNFVEDFAPFKRKSTYR